MPYLSEIKKPNVTWFVAYLCVRKEEQGRVRTGFPLFYLSMLFIYIYALVKDSWLKEHGNLPGERCASPHVCRNVIYHGPIRWVQAVQRNVWGSSAHLTKSLSVW